MRSAEQLFYAFIAIIMADSKEEYEEGLQLICFIDSVCYFKITEGRPLIEIDFPVGKKEKLKLR